MIIRHKWPGKLLRKVKDFMHIAIYIGEKKEIF